MKTTKVSIRNEYGDYSVEVSKTDMALSELLEEVIEPALLAAGYSQSVIDEYLGGRQDDGIVWPESCYPTSDLPEKGNVSDH